MRSYRDKDIDRRLRVKPGLPPWEPHVRFRRVQTLVREGSPLVKLRKWPWRGCQTGELGARQLAASMSLMARRKEPDRDRTYRDLLKWPLAMSTSALRGLAPPNAPKC